MEQILYSHRDGNRIPADSCPSHAFIYGLLFLADGFRGAVCVPSPGIYPAFMDASVLGLYGH